jgi:hypothetical protein
VITLEHLHAQAPPACGVVPSLPRQLLHLKSKADCIAAIGLSLGRNAQVTLRKDELASYLSEEGLTDVEAKACGQ